MMSTVEMVLEVKNPHASTGNIREGRGFDPWVRKVPWRRKWQPIPVFLPGECLGRRSLAGYSPQGHKEVDTAKVT